jgi:D-sedoheptulose 7-phosphate isomerase
MTSEHDSADVAGLEALYPFLYSDSGDLDKVLAQVRQSTVDKAHEIIALRRTVCENNGERLLACAQEMALAFDSGGRLLAFGNGGSSTDAQDLASLFLSPSGDARPLPAFGLTNDIAVVTALSNDIGFDVVFARQLGAFGRAGDIAVGLSTSGNSVNLLRAFDEAARRGMLTIGISGYDGGKMAELDTIDYLFVVPSPSVHRIQEAQTTLYHALWELCLGKLSLAALAAQEAGREKPAPRADHH